LNLVALLPILYDRAKYFSITDWEENLELWKKNMNLFFWNAT